MNKLFGNKTISEQIEDLKSYGTTIKEAGFNSVWGAFIEDFYENGLDVARRKVSTLTKQASEGPFVEGQNQAIDFILNVNSLDNNKTVKENWEMKNMNSFEMGKVAAFNNLVELAESDASVSDVIGVIRETLDLDLEKSASADDHAYRLGIETACYDFLKEAGNVYGSYEVEQGQDELVFTEIFEKMAGERLDKVKGVANKAGILAGLAMGDAKRTAGKAAKTVGQNKLKSGLATAATLGAIGGGVALKKRHDQKKGEQEKTASDHAVEEAMQVLLEAGYEFQD